MKQGMRPRSERVCRFALAFLISLAVLFASASQAAAQQKDKKNKNNTLPSGNASVLNLTDEQQIDYMVSTMLGAWQVGDVEKLHQSYADDVTIITGPWNPPVVGWSDYLPLYQQQRAHMTQVRMDRSNTFIKTNGTCGWATYQWDFAGTVDGQPSTSQGHTTLVAEKRNGKWVIVLNHTSVAEGLPTKTGGSPPSTQPH